MRVRDYPALVRRWPLLLAFLVPALANANTTYSVTIDVTEDGEDYLLLNGNTLEWEHISLFANGGLAGEGTFTETDWQGNQVQVTDPWVHVSGTDSSDSSKNFTNDNWYNGIQGFNCTGLGGCPFYDSQSQFEFNLEAPYTLTGIIGNVTLTTQICQGGPPGTCTGTGSNDSLPTILDQPGSNGGTLVVDLNDVPAGGTHEFEITLTWTVGPSVPEPATFVLGGAGLLALGLLRQARRRRG